jgi:hypothetical protein
MRPSIQFLLGISVLALAGIGFWFGVSGLIDGSVEVFSKQSRPQMSQEGDPGWYWVNVGIWLAEGVGMTTLAVINIRESIAGRRRYQR